MTRRRQLGMLGAIVLWSAVAGIFCSAQEQGTGPAASETASEKNNSSPKTDVPPEANTVAETSHGTPTGLVGRFVDDQRQIWTSPARLRFSDAEWLVPLSGITAGLFVTDSDYSNHLSQNPTTIRHYKTLSNAGVAALVGGAGGMWALGHVKHNEHWSETGFLSGEAALNSLVMVEELKYSLRRERPFQGDGSGSFFQNGGTSFPSEHAAAAWSVAGVIAHEYPGPLTKIMAYGLASLVDISRIRARQHFPSDVLVGSMIGNLVAQNIYSRHHDFDLGGGEWRSISQLFRGNGDSSPANQGSPYAPLDSWIYPAFDRLAALGVIDRGFAAMRPWTRLECAHLVQDASDRVNEGEAGASEASGLVGALESEFVEELNALLGGANHRTRLESVYSRTMHISGKPLADSYHFGQTIINDYGRPYQEGFDNVSGFSGYAIAGKYSIYVRGEYQHAPSAPPYALPVRQAIANADANPLQPANPIATVNQFRLLDTYVGVNLENWELTFGKQSLWWGPGKGGALLFSDNAEPIYMFRASRVAPFELPWIFQRLGPMKLDLFYGKLSGNEFPPRPLIHGEKVSFKPTPNLELAFTRTVEFAGVGRGLTLDRILRSYFILGHIQNETLTNDPGKRTGGFDLSYRIPHLREWLTVYTDSLTTDYPSPLFAPRRAGINPGFYLARFPKLPKLDLRVEGVDTITYLSRGGDFIYFDNFYRDLYTNKQNLIGSWLGREGRGLQCWTTYWFSPRNSLQFGYRHAKVASDFIPGGETANDSFIKLDWWARPDLSLSTFVQYERWKAPLLAPSPQSNWTSSIEISFHPHKFGSLAHLTRQVVTADRTNEGTTP